MGLLGLRDAVLVNNLRGISTLCEYIGCCATRIVMYAIDGFALCVDSADAEADGRIGMMRVCALQRIRNCVVLVDCMGTVGRDDAFGDVFDDTGDSYVDDGD